MSGKARISDEQLTAGLRDLIGPVFFAAILLLIFITLTPLSDRSDAAILGTQEGGSFVNQALFPLITLALAMFAGLYRPQIFRAIYHPVLAVVLAWLLLTILTSADPSLSARRMLFNIFIIVIAALALALPRTLEEFADILALAAGLTVVACWAAVVLAPSLAIHWASDAVETDLAGNWRGIFPHKNQAGAIMVAIVFIGLFYARVRNEIAGWAIAAAAAAFLFFTKSKTSMALLPLILVLSLVLPRVRSLFMRGVVAFTLLIVLNLATIGSSVPGPVQSVVRTIMPDATFTGRTDLWAYALRNIAAKPVFGHGYGAFWRTEATMYKDRVAAGPEDWDAWMVEVGTDAHNGYVEIALSIGIPGLLLVLYWVMLLPLREYGRVLHTPENEEVANLFLRLWLFGLYLTSLESILFSRSGHVWFLMLMAIFGFRLLGRYPLNAERQDSPPASALRQR